MGKTYKTEILYDVNLIQVSKGGNSQLNASFLLSNKMGISEVIAGKKQVHCCTLQEFLKMYCEHIYLNSIPGKIVIKQCSSLDFTLMRIYIQGL